MFPVLKRFSKLGTGHADKLSLCICIHLSVTRKYATLISTERLSAPGTHLSIVVLFDLFAARQWMDQLHLPIIFHF